MPCNQPHENPTSFLSLLESKRRTLTLRVLYILIFLISIALLKAILDSVLLRGISLTGGLILCFISQFLLVRKSDKWAHLLLFVAAWICATTAVYTSGSVVNVSIFWFAIIVCLVGLLSSINDFILWSSLSGATILALFVADIQGLIPPSPNAKTGFSQAYFHVMMQFIAIVAIVNTFLGRSQAFESEIQKQFSLLEAQVSRAQKAEALAVSSAEAKVQFLANMSHEMRTPLNSIIGFSSRLSKHADSFDQREIDALTIINKNGNALNRLLNELIELSRLEGLQDIALSDNVSLYDVLKGVEVSVGVVAHNYGIGLNVSLNEEPLKVRSCKVELDKIISALIYYVIRQLECGQILIFSEKSYSSARLSICCQGEGLSQVNKDTLFEAHYESVLNSKKDIPLSALGLVIAKRRSTLIGCKLSAEHNESGELIFVLEIPLSSNGNL